jgi:bifunctional UDP-N-acetylglucosamine pyrophosphorylase/glucosamine-1-phosphate N-acetyltransferase
VQAVTAEDVLAPNSRQDLAMADMVMQDRIQREHREGGVTIVSPINTYIEDGASIGLDTTIQPFSFVGRDASIGAECTIGPFAFVPRSSVVREGTTVAGNVSRETALMQVEP